MTMNKLCPVEIVPPGVYVRMELEARGWTQAGLADELGCAISTIRDIIDGERAITPEVATALAMAFGTGGQVWMNLQTSYDLWRAGQATMHGGGFES